MKERYEKKFNEGISLFDLKKYARAEMKGNVNLQDDFFNVLTKHGIVKIKPVYETSLSGSGFEKSLYLYLGHKKFANFEGLARALKLDI